MVWTREKGGRRGVEQGGGGEGWRWTTSRKAKEKVERLLLPLQSLSTQGDSHSLPSKDNSPSH
ncbi:hypothetical protein E2C01_018690 [Portunus trituberculatus]|uniref:Uncharacterized protein n=1 Tax=Portunus trituberculatus TaxID=210409 RepID=A0A5B7DV71_PORTR|nr:hypothetical protein [Portunus trituberculatus]